MEIQTFGQFTFGNIGIVMIGFMIFLAALSSVVYLLIRTLKKQ